MAEGAEPRRRFPASLMLPDDGPVSEGAAQVDENGVDVGQRAGVGLRERLVPEHEQLVGQRVQPELGHPPRLRRHARRGEVGEPLQGGPDVGDLGRRALPLRPPRSQHAEPVGDPAQLAPHLVGQR